MKTFRIFYKFKNDPTTATSCKQEEYRCLFFSEVAAYAEKTAEVNDWRVVMVAELPK